MSLHHRGNPAANTGEHHETQIPPATLLIALVLACSAGAASAATTSTSGSWLGGMETWVECLAGNPVACMAADGGSGSVSPDTVTNPEIKNN